VNGQENVLSLHTHGHKATITHLDGVERPKAQQVIRDVYDLSSAQRIDLQLSTQNDGLHSYGPGVWLFHNHAEKGITTNGRGPGGDISMVVYRSYLENDGMPKLQGVGVDKFLDPEYNAGNIPVWAGSEAANLLGEAGSVEPDAWRVVILGLVFGLIVGLLSLLRSSVAGTGREMK
jgi:hypothetical protein